MARVDYKELKKGGFMRQVQKDCFSMRLRSVGGHLTVEQLKTISGVAEKYGQGYIHLTSRQGIEIPYIRLEDIAKVKGELAQAGLEQGACGPRVRTVTACQGKDICPSGLIDTATLARELDARYFARDLVHKFKVGVTGCSNNCLKAEENDVGIKGGMKPAWQQELCSFCGLCAAVCPAKAIEIDKAAQELRFAEHACQYCGKCVKSCSMGAWMGTAGYLLFFGGMFGNKIAIAERILPLLHNKEEVFRVIDATLEFFNSYGKPGERFRLTVERVGWASLEKLLWEVLGNGQSR